MHNQLIMKRILFLIAFLPLFAQAQFHLDLPGPFKNVNATPGPIDFWYYDYSTGTATTWADSGAVKTKTKFIRYKGMKFQISGLGEYGFTKDTTYLHPTIAGGSVGSASNGLSVSDGVIKLGGVVSNVTYVKTLQDGSLGNELILESGEDSLSYGKGELVIGGIDVRMRAFDADGTTVKGELIAGGDGMHGIGPFRFAGSSGWPGLSYDTPLPNLSSNTLIYKGAVDASILLAVPSQTGNSGKVLGTNGTATSWVAPSGGTPAGSTNNIQINNAGSFGAIANGTTGQNLTGVTSGPPIWSSNNANLLAEIGPIITEPWTNTSAWTNVGTATFSASSGTLTVTGGTPSTPALGNYLRASTYGNSCYSLPDDQADITVGTINTTSFGIAFGFQGRGIFSTNSFQAYVSLASGNLGQIVMYSQNSNSVAVTSSSVLPISSGDVITQRLSFGYGSVTLFAYNKTQKIGISKTAYFLDAPISIIPNCYQHSISAVGGTHTMTAFTATIHDKKGADFIVLGDSFTALVGLYPSFNYFRLIQDKVYDVIIPYAGSGNTIDDMVPAEILALCGPGTKLILQAGTNNTAHSETGSTVTGLITTLLSALTGHNTVGTNFFISEICARGGIDESPFVAAYATAFTSSGSIIPTYFATRAPSTVFANPDIFFTDLIHPNAQGNEILSEIYLNSVPFRRKNQQLANAGGSSYLSSPNLYFPPLNTDVNVYGILRNQNDHLYWNNSTFGKVALDDPYNTAGISSGKLVYRDASTLHFLNADLTPTTNGSNDTDLRVGNSAGSNTNMHVFSSNAFAFGSITENLNRLGSNDNASLTSASMDVVTGNGTSSYFNFLTSSTNNAFPTAAASISDGGIYVSKGTYANGNWTGFGNMLATVNNSGQISLTGIGTNLTIAAGNLNATSPVSTLFNYFADVQSVGTTETDLYTNAVAANTLAANGDKIKADYTATMIMTGGATKDARIYFGGTKIFDTGLLTIGVASVVYQFHVTVIRDGSSSVRCTVETTTPGNPSIQYTTVTGLTFSSTNVIKITGQSGAGAATGDVTANMGYVTFVSH